MTQEATSKKSAQTNVAWAYIDWLIQKGMVNPSELPPRPDAQNQNIAYNQQVASQAVAANDARYGGWTTENARQRLNRFCVQQGITCNIINQVGGTPQQKITTADLVLNVNGKELRAHAQVFSPWDPRTAREPMGPNWASHFLVWSWFVDFLVLVGFGPRIPPNHRARIYFFFRAQTKNQQMLIAVWK